MTTEEKGSSCLTAPFEKVGLEAWRTHRERGEGVLKSGLEAAFQHFLPGAYRLAEANRALPEGKEIRGMAWIFAVKNDLEQNVSIILLSLPAELIPLPLTGEAARFGMKMVSNPVLDRVAEEVSKHAVIDSGEPLGSQLRKAGKEVVQSVKTGAERVKKTRNVSGIREKLLVLTGKS